MTNKNVTTQIGNICVHYVHSANIQGGQKSKPLSRICINSYYKTISFIH